MFYQSGEAGDAIIIEVEAAHLYGTIFERATRSTDQQISHLKY